MKLKTKQIETDKNIETEIIANNILSQSKSRILAIDPSGTGTSGFCLVKDGIIEFKEFKNSFWKNHLLFIIELIKKEEIDTIIYENSNWINTMGKDMTSLLKLFG